MLVVPLVFSLHLWFGNVYCWINQPIGPELCKKQCCNNVGSALCGYQVSLMKCLSTTGNGESTYDVTILNFTKMCEFQSMKKFVKCSKIISTKTMGTICKNQSTPDPVIDSDKRNVSLIMSHRLKYDYSHFLQLNMSNESVTRYDTVRIRRVTALAYLKSINQIIYVAESPSQIRIHSSDYHKNKILVKKRERLKVTAFVADDDMVKYKLYFSAFTGAYNIIYKMTVTGSKKRVVSLTRSIGIYSITSHPSKDRLYVCSGKGLLVVGRGRILKTLIKSDTAKYNAVFFNNADRSLYYNDGREIKKLDDSELQKPSGLNSSKVISLAQPISQILMNGERIYVSYISDSYSKLSEIDITTLKHKLIDLSSRFRMQFVFTVLH